MGSRLSLVRRNSHRSWNSDSNDTTNDDGTWSNGRTDRNTTVNFTRCGGDYSARLAVEDVIDDCRVNLVADQSTSQ